jgi:hypothetical protein
MYTASDFAKHPVGILAEKSFYTLYGARTIYNFLANSLLEFTGKTKTNSGDDLLCEAAAATKQ